MQRKLKIIAIGKLKNPWIIQGVNEYLKRLPGLAITELKDSNPDREATDIQALVKPHDYLIVLTERGKTMDSVAFARFLSETVRQDTLVFAIGGPVGISGELERSANFCLSLSPMTFTHDMARLLLVEQLYRAQNILQNGSYHK
jgi:23S rRNA (pseudouridine1915-N3)-methyltransferase